MQALKSKYAKAYKVNMDNYRVTYRRGFRILSPPNWTSPFVFILWCILRSWRWRQMNLFLTPFQIRALFWSCLEGELFFLAINMEFDFSGSNINVRICSTQEGSPKYEGVSMSSCMSSTTKSIGTKKFHIFTRIFSAIPIG